MANSWTNLAILTSPMTIPEWAPKRLADLYPKSEMGDYLADLALWNGADFCPVCVNSEMEKKTNRSWRQLYMVNNNIYQNGLLTRFELTKHLSRDHGIESFFGSEIAVEWDSTNNRPGVEAMIYLGETSNKERMSGSALVALNRVGHRSVIGEAFYQMTNTERVEDSVFIRYLPYVPDTLCTSMSLTSDGFKLCIARTKMPTPQSQLLRVTEIGPTHQASMFTHRSNVYSSLCCITRK